MPLPNSSCNKCSKRNPYYLVVEIDTKQITEVRIFTKEDKEKYKVVSECCGATMSRPINDDERDTTPTKLITVCDL